MNLTSEENAAATVTPPHVLEVIRSAEQELTSLLRRKAEIIQRICTVKQLLAGMANLFGESALDDELVTLLHRGIPQRRRGFTQACRQVLMDSPSPLRARQACIELHRQFPELVRHHKDLLASVTTVFHRLVEYGEARCRVDDYGVRAWEWASDRTASVQTVISMSEEAGEESKRTAPR